MRILDDSKRADFDAPPPPALRLRGRALARWLLLEPGRLAPMSRDTSFYYSFLVLPPRKRRAIIAVWDFCRAVDDAVDEVVPEPEWQGGLTPDARARAASQLSTWRRELAAAFDGEPQTGQGRALQAVHPRVQSAAPAVRGADRRRRNGPGRTSRYQTFDALADYCRRVASAVGLICVEIFGYRDPAGARLRRAVSGSRCSSRTSCATSPPTRAAAASTCRQRTVAVRRHRGRPAARRRHAGRRRRCCGSSAIGRGSTTGCAAEQLPRVRCAQPDGRRDHGRHLLRDPAAHRAHRLRRVQPANPRAASLPRGAGAADLGFARSVLGR